MALLNTTLATFALYFTLDANSNNTTSPQCPYQPSVNNGTMLGDIMNDNSTILTNTTGNASDDICRSLTCIGFYVLNSVSTLLLATEQYIKEDNLGAKKEDIAAKMAQLLIWQGKWEERQARAAAEQKQAGPAPAPRAI